MKVVAKILCVSTILVLIAGCSSEQLIAEFSSKEAYIPRIPPAVKAELVEYFEKSDNKVFVIAVDPSGQFAFGYDYGKTTLKEAAQSAVEQCDSSREAYGIMTKPFVYAINNKVVYKQMIQKAHYAK